MSSTFNVLFTTEFFPDHVTEEFSKPTTAERAMTAFKRLTSYGFVIRAYVVCAQDDTIAIDWTANDGVVFPLPEDDSEIAVAMRRAHPPFRS